MTTNLIRSTNWVYNGTNYSWSYVSVDATPHHANQGLFFLSLAIVVMLVGLVVCKFFKKKNLN
jgi:hypothetical protein